MQTFYKSKLLQEFNERIDRNSSYSLRAFAKSLKVDVAALSRILSDKSVPSWKIAQALVTRLSLTPKEQELFLSSVAEAQKQRNLLRLNPEVRSFNTSENTVQRELSEESFKVISDWYHYAILELTFTVKLTNDPALIARKLGITVMQAKLAIERLLELGLLVETGKVLKKTDKFLTTANKDITTSALRRRQEQILQKAITSLNEDSIEVRDTTSICMAIDSKKIPEAKKRITEFRRSLCAFLESGEQDMVYEMHISLFPIQKNNETKERLT